MTRRLTILLVALLHTVLAGCMSHETYVEKRRQGLLEIYPTETTTRADVAKRWEPTKPEFSYTRPSAGWAALDVSFVGQQVQAVETRIGRSVAVVERYFGVDGLFGLCRCWFYFDSSDRLVDVDWQYVSD